MAAKRNSLSPVLIGLAALAFGCGDSKGDDGEGNSGATGGTASGGSSGGGMPGTGGVETLAGRGGSGSGRRRRQRRRGSGSGGSGGAAEHQRQGWQRGSPPVPEGFPRGSAPSRPCSTA